MNQHKLIQIVQECMDNEAEYTEFLLYEYIFLAHYFSVIQPKNILILGGFTNIDFFIASSLTETSQIHATNVNYSSNPSFLEQKHSYYKELFGYNGNYTFVNDLVNLKDYDFSQYDLIWDNIKCIQNADLLSVTNLILTHYQSPKSFIWKDFIGKKIPLKIELRSMSIFSHMEDRLVHNLHNFFSFKCDKQKFKYNNGYMLVLDRSMDKKVAGHESRQKLLEQNNNIFKNYSSSEFDGTDWYESFDFLKNG